MIDATEDIKYFLEKLELGIASVLKHNESPTAILLLLKQAVAIIEADAIYKAERGLRKDWQAQELA